MIHYLKTFLFLGSLLGAGLLLLRGLLAARACTWVDARCWVVVPIVGIGLSAPSVWIYYGAVLAAVALLPRSRTQAAGLYILLIFALPRVAYDTALASVRLVTIDTRVAAALGLIAAWRFPACNAGGSMHNRPFLTIIVLFVALQLFVDARVIDPSLTSVARSVVTIAAAWVLPLVLMMRAYPDADAPPSILSYVMVAGFATAPIAIFEFVRHWPLYQSIESNLGVFAGLSRTLALRGGFLRATGPFVESTSFGLFMAISTTITIAMRSAFRSSTAHAVAVAVCCAATFATLSRNAWFGAIIGFAAIQVYRRRHALALGFAAAILVTGASIALIAPESGSTASLLGKGNTVAADTATYRSNLFAAGVPLFRAQPLIGYPTERLRTIMRTDGLTSGALSVDFVNTYLYYALAAGIGGLLLFTLSTLYPAVLLMRKRDNMASDVDREIASALFGSLVSLAIMLVGTSFFDRITSIWIVLIAATWVLLAKRATIPEVSRERPRRMDGIIIVDPATGMIRSQGATGSVGIG